MTLPAPVHVEDCHHCHVPAYDDEGGGADGSKESPGLTIVGLLPVLVYDGFPPIKMQLKFAMLIFKEISGT